MFVTDAEMADMGCGDFGESDLIGRKSTYYFVASLQK
jgi:hypothetical protein